MGRLRISSGGFTITELLLAMMITGIILAAVASLTFAVGRLWAHNGAGDQIASVQQTVARRAGDLVRHGRLVLEAGSRRLRLWGADLDEDGRIDVAELVEIAYDARSGDVRRIQYAAPASAAPVEAALLAVPGGWEKAVGEYGSLKKSALLAGGVTAWRVSADADAPASRTITVALTVAADGVSRTSSFAATLRSRDEPAAEEILRAQSELAEEDK